MSHRYKHKPKLLGHLMVWDFDHKPPVVVRFDDEVSELKFFDAFYTRESEYTVIYTEHYGYHVFLTNSIESISGTER